MGVVFAFVFLWFAAGVFAPASLSSGKTAIYDLQKGMGMAKIAKDLEEKEIIKSSLFFKTYAIVSGSRGKLQAGRYEISLSMSIASIVKKFATGEAIKEIFTIIEGWTIKNISEQFELRGFSGKEDFLSLSKKDWSGEFDFLNDKPPDLTIEGYIFPDTYEISPESPAEDLIKKSLSNFGKKMTAELKEGISRQEKSIFQIVTMASMIEKEVRTFEDKKIVSGILWKRLGVGMPLQVDATVNYVTGKNDSRASIADIQIDSPYNTYKYYGLPKGPISNPGLDSISAAIYPTETDYWYYLSADGSGETIFSKTLEEHSKAVAKHLGSRTYNHKKEL